jgi:N-acyl-D-amino-acid deacylase
VVVFDPATVADRTSYQDPTAAPVGIEYVLVNGDVVVEHGTVDTQLRVGNVLRRGSTDA